MTLTNVAIRNAAPKEKPYKISDGGGLYLLVQPGGSKLWRKKYRYNGKEKCLSIGPYPRVTLAEAREAREAALKALDRGEDPSFLKQEEKRKRAMIADNTFEATTNDWWQHKRGGWSDKHSKAVMQTLKANIFPYIGKGNSHYRLVILVLVPLPTEPSIVSYTPNTS
ncbi:MAG: Arm DNA-binding domain-containing protein, partial [Gammaproteobacteria bacterium]